MRFTVAIENEATGERRDAQFESPYDATAVLVELVEGEILRPGESIIMRDPPRDGHDRRREQVPSIERVA